MSKVLSIFLMCFAMATTAVAEENTSEPNKLFVSWKEVQERAEALAEAVKDKGPFEGIVAVARGGMIPATIVAHSLGIKNIKVFSLTSYANKTQSEIHVHHAFSDLKGKWLVVDELIDSGETFKLIKSKYLPKSYYAVVYGKPRGIDHCDTCIETVANDVWIVFPWEKD